jgi:hypothetical protein
MHDHDGSGGGSDGVPPAGTADQAVGGRRRFLESLAFAPLAPVLAGCTFEAEVGDDEETGRGTDDGGTGWDGIRFENRYAMELVDQPEGAPETRIVGRFAGEDHVVHYERGDSVLASYVVDGDSYIVSNGECVRYPGVSAREGSETGEGSTAVDATELERVGTTTLDDEEVVAYELPPASTDEDGEPLTYYVSTETRYVRRIESATGVVDYDSWGDVDAVEPPDGECRDAG